MPKAAVVEDIVKDGVDVTVDSAEDKVVAAAATTTIPCTLLAEGTVPVTSLKSVQLYTVGS